MATPARRATNDAPKISVDRRSAAIAPVSTPRARARRSRSAVLGDLEDLVGYQAVGLTVNRVRGLRIGSLDEAEDLAGLLVDPVALVVHAVLALDGDVGLVRLGDVGRRDAVGHVVNVHVERHRGSFARDRECATNVRTRTRFGLRRN